MQKFIAFFQQIIHYDIKKNTARAHCVWQSASQLNENKSQYLDTLNLVILLLRNDLNRFKHIFFNTSINIFSNNRFKLHNKCQQNSAKIDFLLWKLPLIHRTEKVLFLWYYEILRSLLKNNPLSLEKIVQIIDRHSLLKTAAGIFEKDNFVTRY